MTRSSKAKSRKKTKPKVQPLRWLRRLALRYAFLTFAVLLITVGLHREIPPDPTFYMTQESNRLGDLDYQWISIDEVAPAMVRSIVAAEDSNFCGHWGFDMKAIRTALEEGSGRGASTLTQQVVKNVYLWHGRSWVRKALEAVITPTVELIWSKRRILEVYLNIAEFDEGVFGIEAAARHYFGVGPDELTNTQAGRLAALLPDPKGRSASKPTKWLRERGSSIAGGAATIQRDGRSACFED